MSSSRLKSRRRNEQGSKWARVAIAILSTIGVIDTGSITLHKWGWIRSLSCPGGTEGCDKVLNSPWGDIVQGTSYSIPLSLAGFISYLTVLLLAIIPFLPWLSEKKNNLSRPTWWGLFLISTSMSLFSMVLISIMIHKIEAFCFFCVLSAIISTLILIITFTCGGWEEPRELISRGFLLSIVVIIGGLIWSSSVDPNTEKSQLQSQGVAPMVKSESSFSTISLAKHLTANNIILYNAYWCPHCHDQKEMFGKDAVKELLLVECAADGINSQAELCKQKGITGYPSWEIQGEIKSGVKSLNELADVSNYKGPKEF